MAPGLWSGQRQTALGAEQALCVVRVRFGGAGAALAALAAPQLIVDPPGFVPADSEDAKVAFFGRAGAEDDIDPAAGLVGGNRDAAYLAGARHDDRFPGFVSGGEKVMGERELRRELLGLCHGPGGDEQRLPGGMDGGDFGQQGGILSGLRAEEAIRMVDADQRTMGRDAFDCEAVDKAELFGLRGGGAGHAAGAGIKSREVLERDGREDAALAARRETFWGFEGGVETGGPAAVTR